MNQNYIMYSKFDGIDISSESEYDFLDDKCIHGAADTVPSIYVTYFPCFFTVYFEFELDR